MVAAAVVASAMATGQTLSAAPDVPTVVLHLTSLIDVPPNDLANAQKTAAESYARIGVRLVWTDVLARAADGALHLEVILLGEQTADGKNANRTAFGQAGRATGRAYIYCARIADYARHSGSDPARVLALVLAHEVGHMLLPQHSHTPSGLMRGTWTGRIVRVPHFTADQAVTIRTLLTTATAAN